MNLKYFIFRKRSLKAAFCFPWQTVRRIPWSHHPILYCWMSILSFQEQLYVILMFSNTAASWDSLNKSLWGWSAQLSYPSCIISKALPGVGGDTANPPNISTEKYLSEQRQPRYRGSIWKGWSRCGWEPDMSRSSCLASVSQLTVLLADFFLKVKIQETARLHSNLFQKQPHI